MKQSQEIAEAAQFQARMDSTMEFKNSLLQSDTYWAVRRKLEAGERLDDVDRRVLRTWASNVVDMWENAHFQYQNGYLPEDHWQGILREIDTYVRFPEVIDYWKQSELLHRDSFIQFMTPIMNGAETEIE